MSVERTTVRRIAKLARWPVPESRLEAHGRRADGIFQWVEMLGEVNVEGVPGHDIGGAQKLKWRETK